MERYLQIAEAWANLLDSQFHIGPIKFGLDPLLDLIPGAGDVAGVLLSLYLIWLAYKMHLPARKIVRMLFNIGLDFLIGLVPFLGAIGDVFYKANLQNVRILKQFTTQSLHSSVVPEEQNFRLPI